MLVKENKFFVICKIGLQIYKLEIIFFVKFALNFCSKIKLIRKMSEIFAKNNFKIFSCFCKQNLRIRNFVIVQICHLIFRRPKQRSISHFGFL